jgi:cyclic pyranopterin phosphate synthase
VIDRAGRSIDYLRLSVTERCNLRCVYCMPESGIELGGHEDVLDFDETVRAVELISGAVGLRKLRVTGGEPLVRRDLPVLLSMLRDLEVEELCLTTNGVLLEQYAQSLRDSGVTRVNVSIDSLRNDRLARIARRDIRIEQLEAGLDAALDAGLGPVSVNCVVLRGINDDEIQDFMEWSSGRPGVTVRFIEHMPTALPSESFVSMEEILQRVRSSGTGFQRVERSDRAGGTAEAFYAIEGSGTIFGVIAPLSGTMCQRCNRLRLSARGLLFGCLASPATLDIRHLLRRSEGIDEALVLRAIAEAVRDKPEGHGGCIRTEMWKIGG